MCALQKINHLETLTSELLHNGLHVVQPNLCGEKRWLSSWLWAVTVLMYYLHIHPYSPSSFDGSETPSRSSHLRRGSCGSTPCLKAPCLRLFAVEQKVRRYVKLVFSATPVTSEVRYSDLNEGNQTSGKPSDNNLTQRSCEIQTVKACGMKWSLK